MSAYPVVWLKGVVKAGMDLLAAMMEDVDGGKAPESNIIPPISGRRLTRPSVSRRGLQAAGAVTAQVVTPDLSRADSSLLDAIGVG